VKEGETVFKLRSSVFENQRSLYAQLIKYSLYVTIETAQRRRGDHKNYPGFFKEEMVYLTGHTNVLLKTMTRQI